MRSISSLQILKTQTKAVGREARLPCVLIAKSPSRGRWGEVLVPKTPNKPARDPVTPECLEVKQVS